MDPGVEEAEATGDEQECLEDGAHRIGPRRCRRTWYCALRETRRSRGPRRRPATPAQADRSAAGTAPAARRLTSSTRHAAQRRKISADAGARSGMVNPGGVIEVSPDPAWLLPLFVVRPGISRESPFGQRVLPGARARKAAALHRTPSSRRGSRTPGMSVSWTEKLDTVFGAASDTFTASTSRDAPEDARRSAP